MLLIKMNAKTNIKIGVVIVIALVFIYKAFPTYISFIINRISNSKYIVSGNNIVPLYGVNTIRLEYPTDDLINPWEDASVSAEFVTPSGKKINVNGFYYGTDSYQVRFSPTEIGKYNYSINITGPSGNKEITDNFISIESTNSGFVRQDIIDRQKFIFDNGTPFYPIGLQDCAYFQTAYGNNSTKTWYLDGDQQNDKCTENNPYCLKRVTLNTYLDTYRNAGFNLFRWNDRNCSFSLWWKLETTGNAYSEVGGKWADDLFYNLKKRGFRIFLTIFNEPIFGDEITDSPKMESVKRYVKYVINRYSPYVDIWELMNENTATDYWIHEVTQVFRQNDPYNHPISISWEKPSNPNIDIISPHWYNNEPENLSAINSYYTIRDLISMYAKPVIFGEQGNTISNWDPRSALRMRLRTWSALFAQGSLIFWNMSSVKGNALDGIYIGPEERSYINTIRLFFDNVPKDSQVEPLYTSQPNTVKSFALRSEHDFFAYITNSKSLDELTKNISITVNIHENSNIRWIDPSTGYTIENSDILKGNQVITIPPFSSDIALMIIGKDGSK